MSLHLIELPLSLKSLSLWAGQRNLSRQMDEGLVLHHLLGEAFGPAALQPFRLMVAPRAETASLYAYARQDSATLKTQAHGVLTPDMAAVLNLNNLRSLPRSANNWTAGQRLGFDVKLRPVVRLASALQGFDENRAAVQLAKGAEVDAFLAKRLRNQEGTREDIYLDWLATRLAPAAQIDLSLSRLASFQRTRIQRNGRPIEGPEIVIHGTFTIHDVEAFTSLLSAGIGRHKSYGYGMLLLRPPQRQGSC